MWKNQNKSLKMILGTNIEKLKNNVLSKLIKLSHIISKV
jgi:hypothetical protein